MQRRTCNVGLIVGLVLYLIVLGLTATGLEYGRRWAASRLGTAESQREWEAWRRQTAGEAAGRGGVQRRPVQAPKPPLLILLTEHYPLIFCASLVSVTILFGVLWIMLRGALATPSVPIGERSADAERRTD